MTLLQPADLIFTHFMSIEEKEGEGERVRECVCACTQFTVILAHI